MAIQYNAGTAKILGSSGPSNEEIASGFGKVEGGLADAPTASASSDLSVGGDELSLGTDDDIPGMGGDDELTLDLSSDAELDLGGDSELELTV